MEVVGFCIIKKNSTTGMSAIGVENFEGNPMRVVEFGKVDNCVMCIDSKGSAIGVFDRCDVVSSFECEIFNDIICRPNLSLVEKIQYSTRCMTRKGGYNQLLANMVITASLHKSEFNDGFLWSKQD